MASSRADIAKRIEHARNSTEWFGRAFSKYGKRGADDYDPLWLPAALAVVESERLPLRAFYDFPEKIDPAKRETLRLSGPAFFEAVADYLGIENPYYVRTVSNTLIKANADRWNIAGKDLITLGAGNGRGEFLMMEVDGKVQRVNAVDISKQYLKIFEKECKAQGISFKPHNNNFMRRSFWQKNWGRIRGDNSNRFAITGLGIIFGDDPLTTGKDSEELGALDLIKILYAELKPGKYEMDPSTQRMKFTGDIIHFEFDNTMGTVLDPAELGMDQSVIVRKGDIVTMPAELCPPIGPAYNTPIFLDWMKGGFEANYENANLRVDLKKVRARAFVEHEGDWRAMPYIDLEIANHPPLQFPPLNEATIRMLKENKSPQEAEEMIKRAQLPPVHIADQIVETMKTDRYSKRYFTEKLNEQETPQLPSPDGSPGEPARLPIGGPWRGKGVEQHIYTFGKLER